jgi:hypothetical protein
MSAGNQKPVLEVVNIADAARRLGVCLQTLRRKVASSGIQPDAILLLGSSQRPSPLFVASRLRELGELLKK